MFVLEGNNFQVSGTEISASIWASVIALINDALVTEKRSPLGFLNSGIYSTTDAGSFFDIVQGLHYVYFQKHRTHY